MKVCLTVVLSTFGLNPILFDIDLRIGKMVVSMEKRIDLESLVSGCYLGHMERKKYSGSKGKS